MKLSFRLRQAQLNLFFFFSSDSHMLCVSCSILLARIALAERHALLQEFARTRALRLLALCRVLCVRSLCDVTQKRKGALSSPAELCRYSAEITPTLSLVFILVPGTAYSCLICHPFCYPPDDNKVQKNLDGKEDGTDLSYRWASPRRHCEPYIPLCVTLQSTSPPSRL